MTSSNPYLLRALYEWIVDNGMTPHLLVDTRDSRVRVPVQFVKDNSIVLNLAPSAVRDLMMRNDFISFSARFGGVPQEILVPVGSARMIYARETGQGMSLPEEESATITAQDATEEPPKDPGPGPSTPPKGSHLRRVK
jgi:stringent starvation protein B